MILLSWHYCLEFATLKQRFTNSKISTWQSSQSVTNFTELKTGYSWLKLNYGLIDVLSVKISG